MSFQKALINLLICLYFMVFPLTSISAENSTNNETKSKGPDVEFLYMVKGSIMDYWPKIFEEFKVKYIEAKSGLNWAGDLYLIKKSGTTIPIATHEDFYIKSLTVAKRQFFNICYKFFKDNGLKKGAVLVDHFEPQVLNKDGYASVAYSGNVLCLTKR